MGYWRLIRGFDIYYRKNCLSAASVKRAKYRVHFGNTLDNRKTIEIDIQFVSGDDLTTYDMPQKLFGNDVASTHYTILVAEYYSLSLVWSVAKPTSKNDGSSATSRANDISDFTQKKYYFSR